MGRLAPTLTLAVLCTAVPVRADWAVVTEPVQGQASPLTVARASSSDGSTLEFLRGADGAFLMRFALPKGLATLEDGFCPTVQVDRWAPMNRFSDAAPCTSTPERAQYLVATVDGAALRSAHVLQFMNGNQISLRYRLAGGIYRETAFSLAGSKRALSAAIGENIAVVAP